MNWLKYKAVYFIISAFLLIPSLYFLTRFGFYPSIDFTGGTVLKIQIGSNCQKAVDIVQNWRNELTGLEGLEFKINDQCLLVLKSQPINNKNKDNLIKKLEAEFDFVEEQHFETVGPILGRELVKKTVLAVALSALFILLYIAFQFKQPMYGVCAILAMLNDSLILLGLFSFLGHFYSVKIDTLFVTAVLTILSFSVHDTVVIYDQIRELVKKNPRRQFTVLVNQAISETIVRSINNSLTIIFMLLALYLLGGQTIRWFVFALLVGTIAGTYSSTFIATPLLVVWQKLKK